MKTKNIRVSVYCTPEETPAVKEKLALFLPAEAAIAEEVLAPENKGGVFDKPLVCLSSLLVKGGDMNELLEKIFGGLRRSDVEKINSELDLRVDDSCNLYIRLGRRDFMEDALVLRENDPVHVKIKIEVYPAKKEKALAEIKKFLEKKLEP
jgi:RNA binding exosome subunit